MALSIPNAAAIEVLLAEAGAPPHRLDPLTGRYVSVNETDTERYDRIANYVSEWLRWRDFHDQREMWGYRCPHETV